MIKMCSKCGVEKEEIEFSGRRPRTRKGGKIRIIEGPWQVNTTCRKCVEIYARKWRYKDGGGAESSKKWRKNNKLKCFNAYGGAFCILCGENDINTLTIDHINNDGGEHRRELAKRKATGSRGGDQFYFVLKKLGYPSGYQVLCHNCNIAKHLNKGILPESRRKIVLKTYSLEEYAKMA